MPASSDSELSDQDKRALEKLRAAARAYLDVPEEDQLPAIESEKYAFPVGMTDDGELRTPDESSS